MFPLWLILGWVGGGQAATVVFGGARTSLSRSMARQKTFFIGQALAKASLMRRTLTVTTAPIFNSLRRIEPAVALAISVPAKPRRRTAPTSTQASEESQRRSWLARIVAALVRSA